MFLCETKIILQAEEGSTSIIAPLVVILAAMILTVLHGTGAIPIVVLALLMIPAIVIAGIIDNCYFRIQKSNLQRPKTSSQK
jgi:hypothetical protein